MIFCAEVTRLPPPLLGEREERTLPLRPPCIQVGYCEELLRGLAPLPCWCGGVPGGGGPMEVLRLDSRGLRGLACPALLVYSLPPRGLPFCTTLPSARCSLLIPWCCCCC